MADSELSDPRTDAHGPTAKGGIERQDLSRRELAVARRLAESKATIPHSYVSRDVEPDGDSLLARVVVACGAALRAHPAVNGTYRDATLERYQRANVAVTIETADGPQVPTVFDADELDEAGAAARLAELAGLAAANELTSPQTSGATFTVSFAGEGADSFAGIVTPGQAAHLCLGRLRPPGVVTMTLCFDSRALRPPEAAAFLASAAASLQGAGPLES